MTVLITGASRGIGAELALKLADDSINLILVSRNEERLKEVADQCNQRAGESIAGIIPYDLMKLPTEGSEFMQLLEHETKELDMLVNNAGMLIRKPFSEITPDESRSIFEANYFAPAELIRLCLPLLKKSTEASVINVTSMAAVQGSSKFPGLSAYSSSKGALATLTECLAEEFSEFNIRVNALAFGAVQTEMLAEAFPGFEANTKATDMGEFFAWFVKEGWKRFNGKMLPVSNSTP